MTFFCCDWAPLNHPFIWIVPIAGCNVPIDKGNNFLAKHVGAGGLVGTTKGLEVVPGVGKGLVRICGNPLGSGLAVKVVVMI